MKLIIEICIKVTYYDSGYRGSVSQNTIRQTSILTKIKVVSKAGKRRDYT